MAPDPKILDKVKKLFAYQEDAERRNSLHEAENAAQRIQDLLIKNNLSMEDVEGKLHQDDSFDVDRKFVNMSEYDYDHRHGKWLETLMGGLCRYNLCRLIMTPQRKLDMVTWKNIDLPPKFAIIGRLENIEIVKFLFDQVVAKARQSEKMEWSRYQGGEKRGMWRRGYLMGFAMGINAKLREQLEHMQQENNSVTALVRVHSTAVDAFIANQYKSLKSSHKHGNSSGAIETGYANGKSTDLHKGVTSNALNQRLIQ